VTLAIEIRRYRDARTLPLIMLSSLGRKEAGADRAQFAAHLTKPIKQSMLFDTLVNVFAGERCPACRPEPAAGPQFDAQLAERLPLRLLLAEDNAVNQKLALQMLRKMGYRADVAGDGLEVLEALERQPYDIVLMDVQMPELDGLEAARRIRALDPASFTPPRIIAMTANAMQGDREACLAAGMDDYISKPIKVTELQATLERWGQRLQPIAPPPATEPPAVIDWSMLAGLRELQTAGEPDFVQEMLALYLDNAPHLIADLRQAIADQNPAALQYNAHTLKGNSASLGAQRLSALSAELEQIGRRGSIEGAPPLLADVEQEFARVRLAMLGYSTAAA
jgi:CheY-like chemotaxis protein/HPt (histidine-containing phosphotransfer) domain-containing protein